MDTPIEPRSDFRQAARGLMEIFTALTNEGFTEQQALYIIAIMTQNGRGRPNGKTN